mmetsp:Transcript_56716/g.129495  ORF Transcript_56716/g.129495 Transcript_56716/m.129495 type:complete len:91 (+) Transcript_56716:68-340(+)
MQGTATSSVIQWSGCDRASWNMITQAPSEKVTVNTTVASSRGPMNAELKAARLAPITVTTTMQARRKGLDTKMSLMEAAKSLNTSPNSTS